MFVENFFFHVFDLSFFTRQRNVQSACTVSKIRDFLQDFSKFRGKWSELIFRIEKTERGKLHGNIRNPGKVYKNIQDVIIAEYDIVSMEKKNLILSRTMAPKQKKWKGKRFLIFFMYIQNKSISKIERIVEDGIAFFIYGVFSVCFQY